MKKTLAFFLALVMILALCACGTASPAVQAEETNDHQTDTATNNDEVGVEVLKSVNADGDKESGLCGCGSDCECGNSDSGEVIEEKSEDTSDTSQDALENDRDLISIEEFSINPDRGWRNMKVRNLSGRAIPCFILNYVFIDENGDVIDTSGHVVTDRIMIDDGQAFTEQDQHVMADGDYSKVEKVKFTQYTFRDVLNKEFKWVEEYALIDPPVFVRNPDGTFSKAE